MPSVDESEAHCRRQQARFILREDFVLLIFAAPAPTAARASSSAAPACTASTGRCAASRSATGGRPAAKAAACVTEAVRAVARLAFDALGARRVEIRMDDNNARSWRVAERAGFTLEALLRFDAATPQGEPRSTRVYARVRGAEEPMGPSA